MAYLQSTPPSPQSPSIIFKTPADLSQKSEIVMHIILGVLSECFLPFSGEGAQRGGGYSLRKKETGNDSAKKKKKKFEKEYIFHVERIYCADSTTFWSRANVLNKITVTIIFPKVTLGDAPPLFKPPSLSLFQDRRADLRCRVTVRIVLFFFFFLFYFISLFFFLPRLSLLNLFN